MLDRLILFLLALAFAAPVATAACHAPVAGHHAAAPSHHGSAPVERDDAVAMTACVGCVPPSTWTPGRVGEPVTAPVVRASGRVHALTIGRGAPPALPPPRTW